MLVGQGKDAGDNCITESFFSHNLFQAIYQLYASHREMIAIDLLGKM
jgi:hypothetical protein